VTTTLSPLALGGYALGGGYGAVSEADARSTIDAALEAGWTAIDTAETYLDSEERLGRILRGRRDRVFLAAKAFPCESYSRRNLEAALDATLRRLGTDRVDLYQLHGDEDWVQPFGPTPIDELAETLDGLRRSGKALHVGVSNFAVERLDALAQRTTVFSTQNLYSLIDRGHDTDRLHLDVEGTILPYAVRHGIAVLAYSPLSRGLLADDLDPARTFAPDDERHFLPRYQKGVYAHYVALAHRLSAWARQRGHTLTQLAVAWTLRHPAVTTTIVGAKRPEQVAAVAGAERWHLEEAEIAEIDAIVDELPAVAKAAKMTVWDHFDTAVLDRLVARRHATA
jgi:aryl-alcohol dehydrogenase-like predicted oxidoreductase